MKIAVLSDDSTFQSIKFHLKHKQLDADFYHTEDISELYEILFSNTKCLFSFVIIQYGINSARTKALIANIKLHFSSVNCVFLSHKAVQDSLPAPLFDSSEIGLLRLCEHIDTKCAKVYKKQRNWQRSEGNDDDIEWMFKKYEAVINGAGEAIVGIDEYGKITFLNRYACDLFGKGESNLLGRALTDFALDSPLTMESKAPFNGGKNRRVGRGTIAKPDGSFVYVEYTQTLVNNPNDETVSIMVIEDIGDRIKFEAKLKTLANKDILTGLYNRYYLQRALKLERDSRRKDQKTFVLALIDLDNFKEVNDQHGHATGDKLLIALAKRLKESVRRSDLIARLGGDEFVALFRNSSEENAMVVAQNILSHIQDPFDIGGHNICVSASIGLCSSKAMGPTFEQTLENLDTAMYQVKKAGKNGIRLFNTSELNNNANHLVAR